MGFSSSMSRPTSLALLSCRSTCRRFLPTDTPISRYETPEPRRRATNDKRSAAVISLSTSKRPVRSTDVVCDSFHPTGTPYRQSDPASVSSEIQILTLLSVARFCSYTDANSFGSVENQSFQKLRVKVFSTFVGRVIMKPRLRKKLLAMGPIGPSIDN